MRRLLLLAAAARAYREEIMEALTGNLLINGGPDEASMNGWHDVVPGLYNATPPVTAGWEPEIPEHIQTEGCETPENPWQPCENVFKTSYQACTRRQTVPLVTGGVTAEMIDAGEVAVVISEDVKEFYSVDNFFIQAALCRDEKCTHKLRRWAAPCRKDSEVSTEEAYQWCETKGGPGYGNDVWENHNHTFGGGDVVGARYLLFEDGGVDSEYFKGLYGPWFKDASVVIHKTTFTFAPTATPAPSTATPAPSAPSAPTLKPTFQPTTSAPTLKPTFQPTPAPNYYGYGDDDEDWQEAAATPAPKPRPRPCCVEHSYWADGEVTGTTCPSCCSPFDASTMSSYCTAGSSDAGEVAPPFRDCRQEAIDAWSCGTGSSWGETCAACADYGVPTGMYSSFVGYASCPDWVVNALYDDADNGGNCDAHLDTKIASSDECSDCRACFDCGALGTCDLPVEERCWGQGAYPACEVLWQQCDWYYGNSGPTCPTCDGWCSCQDCPGPDPNACDWNCDDSRSEPTWSGTKEDCGSDDDDDDDDSVGKIIGPIVAAVVIVTAAIGPWIYCHVRKQKKAAAAPPPTVEVQVLGTVVSEPSSTAWASETSSAAATAWASEGTVLGVESGPLQGAPYAEPVPSAPLAEEMPPPAPPRIFCSACGAPVQGPFCGQCGARA